MLSRLSLFLCGLLVLSSPALARSAPSVASQARSFPVPPIRARAGLVMDASTGAVLGGKNPHLRLPMASTTKIMTALLALQLGHLSDRITVPSSAFDFEWDATVMGLHPGQVVTLRDLLYGLMLPSGADAANTIAIHYAGSEARFADMMNHEAGVLGMRDTHYVNPHGLTAPNHYSSAYDLALLGRYVSSLPDLMKIARTRTYQWNGHVLTNINHVLFWYPGVDGIKPGYTDDAGICQVLDAQRGGRHVIVTLLNTPDLVIDARNLLDYGLRDFTWVQSSLPADRPSLTLAGVDGAGPYVYFAGSGHYVRGKLWSGYLANGGLAYLGFPRTEALNVQRLQVQYFQNGALALNPSSGQVSRLALGLTPLPSPTRIPTPILTATPVPSPTAQATPIESSIPLRGKASGTATPSPTATRTLTGAHATATPRSATPTPTPLPSPRHATPTPPPPGVTEAPTNTPTPSGPAVTASVFAAFQHTHWNELGAAVSDLRHRHGYAMQIFAYGALAYDEKKHAIYLLPLGDRLLGARKYLPPHPGNVYPGGFAPASVLKEIGWF